MVSHPSLRSHAHKPSRDPSALRFALPYAPTSPTPALRSRAPADPPHWHVDGMLALLWAMLITGILVVAGLFYVIFMA